MHKLNILNELIIYPLFFCKHNEQISYEEITCIAIFIFKQICIDLNTLLLDPKL